VSGNGVSMVMLIVSDALVPALSVTVMITWKGPALEGTPEIRREVMMLSAKGFH
jgi:hypothetical protein